MNSIFPFGLRAFDGPKGTKGAAMPGEGLQQHLTVLAFIVELARVNGHYLLFDMPAVGACQYGFQNGGHEIQVVEYVGQTCSHMRFGK